MKFSCVKMAYEFEIVNVGKSPSSTKGKTTFSEEETEKIYIALESFSIAAIRTILKSIPDKMRLIAFCYDWINKGSP